MLSGAGGCLVQPAQPLKGLEDGWGQLGGGGHCPPQARHLGACGPLHLPQGTPPAPFILLRSPDQGCGFFWGGGGQKKSFPSKHRRHRLSGAQG